MIFEFFGQVCRVVLCVLSRYLEKTDPAACVWDGEMLIIVKMNVSEEPGVSELSSRAVKPLRAAQMTTCRGQQRIQRGLETGF